MNPKPNKLDEVDDYIIIKAGVLKILRASDEKDAKEAMKSIREVFPKEEVSNKTLKRIFNELLEVQ